jgi:excinuclease ABC subunit B
MRRAISETNRRRDLQMAFNAEHGIVPQTIIKSVRDSLEISKETDASGKTLEPKNDKERVALIARLEKEMKEASKMLEFEYAAVLRDRVIQLKMM